MSSTRSLRNVETRKKKARRAIPRTAKTRNQGNTGTGRKRLKKAAGLRRGAKARHGLSDQLSNRWLFAPPGPSGRAYSFVNSVEAVLRVHPALPT